MSLLVDLVQLIPTHGAQPMRLTRDHAVILLTTVPQTPLMRSRDAFAGCGTLFPSQGVPPLLERLTRTLLFDHNGLP